MEMKLYLDVDGVIMGRTNDGDMVLIPDIEKILLYQVLKMCPKYVRNIEKYANISKNI